MSRRRAAGFTLIEILVAMTVFVAGAAGLLALLSAGLAMHRDGMSVAQATRNLDGVTHELRRRVAAGGLWDEARQAWRPESSGSLPDGTVWSARLRATADGEGLLALIRAAAHPSRLARASEVPAWIGIGPTQAQAVDRYRGRARD